MTFHLNVSPVEVFSITSKLTGKHAANGVIWNPATNGGSKISIVFLTVLVQLNPFASATVLLATNTISFNPGTEYATGMDASLPVSSLGFAFSPKLHRYLKSVALNGSDVLVKVTVAVPPVNGGIKP